MLIDSLWFIALDVDCSSIAIGWFFYYKKWWCSSSLCWSRSSAGWTFRVLRAAQAQGWSGRGASWPLDCGKAQGGAPPSPSYVGWFINHINYREISINIYIYIIYLIYYTVYIYTKMEDPQNHRFQYKNCPILDDLGVPLHFRKLPISIYIYIIPKS